MFLNIFYFIFSIKKRIKNLSIISCLSSINMIHAIVHITLISILMCHVESIHLSMSLAIIQS